MEKILIKDTAKVAVKINLEEKERKLEEFMEISESLGFDVNEPEIQYHYYSIRKSLTKIKKYFEEQQFSIFQGEIEDEQNIDEKIFSFLFEKGFKEKINVEFIIGFYVTRNSIHRNISYLGYINENFESFKEFVNNYVFANDKEEYIQTYQKNCELYHISQLGDNKKLIEYFK